MSVVVKVCRRRTIVIPKKFADVLGIGEGSRLLLEVKDGGLVLKPLPDAIRLSLYGEKIAEVKLEELEAVSVEEQGRYIEKVKPTGSS